MEDWADRISESVIPQRGERAKAQGTKQSKGSGLRTVPTGAVPSFFICSEGSLLGSLMGRETGRW